MVRPIQEPFVNFRPTRVFFRLSAVAVIAAALGLSACGRKGPLDAPPGAASSQARAPSTDGQPQPERSLLGDPSSNSSANGIPLAPKGEKKRIPLDALLD